VHLALANEGESGFAGSRTCRSQDTKGACMGKPICVRQGDGHRQPRHRAQKERKDWRPRKSFVCVALDQGVYKCSGGCLWIEIESTIIIESYNRASFYVSL
jgi:hypothetical protein